MYPDYKQNGRKVFIILEEKLNQTKSDQINLDRQNIPKRNKFEQ